MKKGKQRKPVYDNGVYLRILNVLEDKPLCISDIAIQLKVNTSNTNRQIKLLKRLGYVELIKTGGRSNRHIYKITTLGDEIRIIGNEILKHKKRIVKLFNLAKERIREAK